MSNAVTTATMKQDETKLDRLINRIKNRKYLAYVLMAGFAIITIGQFSDALVKIYFSVIGLSGITRETVSRNGNTNLDNDSSKAQEERSSIQVRILSPTDGDVIFVPSTAQLPVNRMIEGDIIGLNTEEIRKRKPWVEVSIKTNQWYPQGSSRVTESGSWVIENAYFGGIEHLIHAVLKDKNGNVLAYSDTKVHLVR